VPRAPLISFFPHNKYDPLVQSAPLVPPNLLHTHQNLVYTSLLSWPWPIHASHIPRAKSHAPLPPLASYQRISLRPKYGEMFGIIVFTARRCLHLAQRSSWKTTSFQLYLPAYLKYSPLPFISGAVSSNPQQKTRHAVVIVTVYHDPFNILLPKYNRSLR
jgi:hypothetical protein